MFGSYTCDLAHRSMDDAAIYQMLAELRFRNIDYKR